MASTCALGPVGVAALAKLRADAGITALVSADRIVDEVPPRTAGQYISVETPGESPNDTLGGSVSLPKFGSFVRLFVRVVGQYPVSKADVKATGSAVKACLDNQDMTVSGYPTVCVDFQSPSIMQESTLNGVPIQELVQEFQVTVHQS